MSTVTIWCSSFLVLFNTWCDVCSSVYVEVWSQLSCYSAVLMFVKFVLEVIHSFTDPSCISRRNYLSEIFCLPLDRGQETVGE